jgi:hypothetical protein
MCDSSSRGTDNTSKISLRAFDITPISWRQHIDMPPNDASLCNPKTLKLVSLQHPVVFEGSC